MGRKKTPGTFIKPFNLLAIAFVEKTDKKFRQGGNIPGSIPQGGKLYGNN